MELDPKTSTDSWLSLPIPEDGLVEVLRAWSGRGQLWSALAAVEAEEIAERRWSTSDVERRAKRVLMEQLLGYLVKWPTSISDWIDALPAELLQPRIISDRPFGGVSWRDTRRMGWPPKIFLGRLRSREPHSLLITSLRWVLEELKDLYDDTWQLDFDGAGPAKDRLETALKVLDIDIVAAANPSMPSAVDLAAINSEGKPWNLLVPVAVRLIRFRKSLLELARECIMPIEDLRWRVFHLAALGQLILALRSEECSIVSIRPLSGGATGPAYAIIDRLGRKWDLWFEAGGAWGYYGISSPYWHVAANVRSAGRALGADLMLIRPSEAALIIECKFSSNGTVVARGGYEQALAYMVECRSEMAQKVIGLVVGPEGVAGKPNWAQLLVGTVGIGSPVAIGEAIKLLFSSAL